MSARSVFVFCQCTLPLSVGAWRKYHTHLISRQEYADIIKC